MNRSLGLYNLIDENGINKSIENVIHSGIDFNTYGSPKGLKDLRRKIAEFLKDAWNYQGDDKNILITSGSQQSISLIFSSLFNNGDTVLIEQPTYFGALDVLKKRNINLVGINLTEDGFDEEELENKIKRYKPKAIYVVPTFNNPTGYAWSNEKRIQFLKLTNKYNILVIEDDPYRYINFTDYNYLTLYEINKGKNVIYLGTFSKLISPSINVGYIICDDIIMNKIYEYKKSYDLCTSLFLQYVVLDYLSNNNLLSIIDKKIPIYKKLLNYSLDSLDDIEFVSKAKGGLFYLVKFNKNIDSKDYESIDNYFIDERHVDMTRINICSYK